MTWICANCNNSNNKRNALCSKCGLVRMGPGTSEKYKILGDYLFPLSLIMRNNGFEHYFIDACAGSGVVLNTEKRQLVDGSPIIMAKTREIVQTKIRDKTKEPQVKCICIEVNKNTFELLKKSTTPFSEYVQCINGDCNDKLDVVLDEISSKVRDKNHFAFVYIDPFGFGQPTIKCSTIERIHEREFTELLIHFSWEGVSRISGNTKNVDHPDTKKAQKARSDVKALNTYLGEGWMEIEEKHFSPSRRRNAYVELYASNLKEYYPKTTYTEIPMGSSNPNYYLFFSSRNKAGYDIMNNIMEKVRRKGAIPLDSYKNSSNIREKPTKINFSLDDFTNS